MKGKEYLDNRVGEMGYNGRRCVVVSDGEVTIALIHEANSKTALKFAELERQIASLITERNELQIKCNQMEKQISRLSGE